MFNPDNYLAKVVETLFVCWQIVFIYLVGLGCVYISDAISLLKIEIGTFSPPRGQSHIQLMSPLFFYFNFHTIIPNKFYFVFRCTSEKESASSSGRSKFLYFHIMTMTDRQIIEKLYIGQGSLQGEYRSFISDPSRVNRGLS